MNSKISLRPFTSSDAEQVIDLLQDVSVYRPDPASVSTLARQFAEQENSYACVAMRGVRLIGFGSLFILSRIRGGRSAIIEDMVVAADVRGQGIGRLVLENLLSQAHKQECFKVSLESSENALGFYQAAGFECGGRILKYGPKFD